jgi:hypothetical protein
MVKPDILIQFLTALFFVTELVLLASHQLYRHRLKRLYGTGRTYDIESAAKRMYFLRFLLFFVPVVALLIATHTIA